MQCVFAQGNRTFLFYSQSRAACWSSGEGGQMWSPGGDIYMQTSSNSGLTWDKPQVGCCAPHALNQCTLCACMRRLCTQASLGYCTTFDSKSSYRVSAQS